MKVNGIPAPKKKSFIKLPNYKAGKKSFIELVAGNMVYPEDALAKNIEGMVNAEYEVDNLGRISDIRIKKEIGYGCD